MARQQPNDRLVALLGEAEWKGTELARAVVTLGAAQGLRLGYDRTSVAHWLSGSRPRPPVPELVAAALTRRIGRAVTPEDTGLVPTRRATAAFTELRPRATDSDARDVVHRMIDLCRQDADPTNRAHLKRSIFSPTGLAVPAWPSTSDQLRTPIDPGAEVTSAPAELLQEMGRLFLDLAVRYGGAHARTSLVIYLADDVASILAAPAPPHAHRELLTTASQLTHILADMTIDAGHPGLAQRYYTIALALARQADDRRQYAITLRSISLQSLTLGHPTTAHRFAHAALEAAGPSIDPAARAFLLAQHALTQAHQHHSRSARATLIDAEYWHEQADSNPSGPFTNYPRPGLEYQRAQTLSALGDWPGALASLSDAARNRNSTQRTPHALTQARLAETHLRLGHLEVACHHWHIFLNVYPRIRSHRADRAHIRLLHAAGRFPHQRHATALLEHAQTVITRSPENP
ncbi:tol-pal system YbgF family protein [Streptomyces sp. NPDC020965]|uniref:tol-pal system YbgF family protein n=1 Tax=Streptomyces sp. NPDC020965 TaxID=3365105 RepID=UPI0037A50379